MEDQGLDCETDTFPFPMGNVRSTSLGRFAAGVLACAMPVGDLPFDSDDSFFEPTIQLNCEVDFESEIPAPGSLQTHFQDTPVFGSEFSIPEEIKGFLDDRLNDAKSSVSALTVEEIPTEACFDVSRDVLYDMFAIHKRLPSKVTITRSGAVFVSYRNTQSDSTLRIEIDNDLDVVATISTKDGYIESGIFDNDFSDKAVAILCGSLLPIPAARDSRPTQTSRH